MNLHLAEISRSVTHGAHAVLVLDQAGWHASRKLRVPENISLLPLPPYAPELNPVENVWAYLRANFLGHCVWNSYNAIVDACCDAWNKLTNMPQRLFAKHRPHTDAAKAGLPQRSRMEQHRPA